MKLLKPIALLFLCSSIFSCSRNIALEKDWSDPKVKSQLKKEMQKDPLFKEYIETQKKIMVKTFLKQGVDLTKYDSLAFKSSMKFGKTHEESLAVAGGKADKEFFDLVNQSKRTLENLAKKYRGLRYLNVYDWNELTKEELTRNFNENIKPSLNQVYGLQN